MPISTSIPVTVVTGTVTPFMENTFSQYSSTSDLLSDTYNSISSPTGWWRPTEIVNSNRISLVLASGPPTGSDRFMRYTYPFGAATPRCSDFTVGVTLQLWQNLTEAWIEVWVRYPNEPLLHVSQCSPPPPYTAEHKFVFGLITGIQRFQIILGTKQGGIGYTVGYPGNETWKSQTTVNLTNEWLDGQWHRWRFHFRPSPTSSSPTGRARWWFDDVLIRDTGAVQTNPGMLYAVALGRNFNSIPALGQDYSVDWGSVRIWKDNPGW